MNKGELQNAKRRALNILDAWNNVTGAIATGTSWYWELQGVIEDAVDCGAQAALDVYVPLDTEKEALTPEEEDLYQAMNDLRPD